MNEREVMAAMVQAMAWIIGIGTASLGVILAGVGKWIVGHIEGLRKTVSEEMRAFDVRIARLETIARLRRREPDEQYGEDSQ